MRRRRVLMLVVLCVVAAACGGDDDDDDDDGGGAAAEPGVVLAKDNVFEPEEITVGVGDMVTWRFEGGNAHNVTGDDGDFTSELMKEGEFEHAFTEAGTFDYTCTVHPGMDGTVIVE